MITETTTTTAAAAFTTHRVVIHPLDRYGSYRVTDRETGQEWLGKSRIPACAAARVLVDCGANPSDRLEMFREGRERPEMTGSIGWFAERTVVENERHGPSFRKFQPFDRTKLPA